EPMGKGLTVVAIADRSVDLLGRRIRDEADNLPATAAYSHFLGHLSPLSAVMPSNVRRDGFDSQADPEHLAAVLREYFRQLMCPRACDRTAGSHLLHGDGTVRRTDHV
ncbi:MAG TPA: hypothetical protein VKB08_08970, partial [Bradyrhizobium sp.]|nr:hypothetical protein [Bradyrhizobium sp.]